MYQEVRFNRRTEVGEGGELTPLSHFMLATGLRLQTL